MIAVRRHNPCHKRFQAPVASHFLTNNPGRQKQEKGAVSDFLYIRYERKIEGA